MIYLFFIHPIALALFADFVLLPAVILKFDHDESAMGEKAKEEEKAIEQQGDAPSIAAET